jgi:hypothetical protein
VMKNVTMKSFKKKILVEIIVAIVVVVVLFNDVRFLCLTNL